MSQNSILLLLRAVNFEAFPCIPAKTWLGFRFLVPTTSAVISDSEEVPTQARNFNVEDNSFLMVKEQMEMSQSSRYKWNRHVSSIMPVTHTATMILVSLVTILVKSLTKYVPSTALKNRTGATDQFYLWFFHFFAPHFDFLVWPILVFIVNFLFFSCFFFIFGFYFSCFGFSFWF